jgi:hypothetical protein
LKSANGELGDVLRFFARAKVADSQFGLTVPFSDIEHAEPIRRPHGNSPYARRRLFSVHFGSVIGPQAGAVTRTLDDSKMES